MARNLGKIAIQKAIVQGNPIGVAYSVDSGRLWKDHAEARPGYIYLVVGDDGDILSAGPDPAWNLIEGYDIWEVPGSDFAALYGHRWDGEKIV